MRWVWLVMRWAVRSRRPRNYAQEEEAGLAWERVWFHGMARWAWLYELARWAWEESVYDDTVKWVWEGVWLYEEARWDS